MAEEWKTEYHAIGEDGQAFAWEDTFEAAKAHDGVVSVERVVYYHEDRTTVWEKADEDSCPNGEHCCCDCDICCDCDKPRNP